MSMNVTQVMVDVKTIAATQKEVMNAHVKKDMNWLMIDIPVKVGTNLTN